MRPALDAFLQVRIYIRQVCGKVCGIGKGLVHFAIENLEDGMYELDPRFIVSTVGVMLRITNGTSSLRIDSKWRKISADIPGSKR